jgi:hypothetical protein
VRSEGGIERVKGTRHDITKRAQALQRYCNLLS